MRDILTTPRLTLRPLEPADAPSYARMIGAWSVAKMLAPVPYPYPVQEAEAFIEGALSRRVERAAWALDASAHGRPALIGALSFRDVRPGVVSIGFWLGEAHQRQGFMAETVRATLGDVFAEPDVETVEAGVFDDNARSRKLLGRFAFAFGPSAPKRSEARDAEIAHSTASLTRAVWAACSVDVGSAAL